MRFIVIPALATLLLAASCTSSKKTTGSPSNSVTTSQQSADADGTSFDKAIVIKAKSETPGIAAEYDWIKKKYPGYKTKSQRLVNHDKKPFDIITIETADGDTKDIYFDISNFFGKW